MGIPGCGAVCVGSGPLIGLAVAAEDSETEYWGKTSDDLQEDIAIANGVISGTLKYISDYSAAGFEGGGNFIALKVGSSESISGVTYKCTVIDGNGQERTVTLDDDKVIVIQIKDKAAQKLRFTAEKDGYGTDVTTLALSGLRCEEEA